jgi:hypothetical protein
VLLASRLPLDQLRGMTVMLTLRTWNRRYGISSRPEPWGIIVALTPSEALAPVYQAGVTTGSDADGAWAIELGGRKALWFRPVATHFAEIKSGTSMSPAIDRYLHEASRQAESRRQ